MEFYSFKKGSKFLPVLIYFSSSFLLHLLWETMQAPLFEGINTIFEHFWMCFYATATGDMIFMSIIYLSLAVVHQDIWWLNKKNVFSYPATWGLSIIIGILLSVSFELWAVFVVGRWTYDAMPIIPILKIGLTPVLQMVLIPVIVLGIVKKFVSLGTASE